MTRHILHRVKQEHSIFATLARVERSRTSSGSKLTAFTDSEHLNSIKTWFEQILGKNKNFFSSVLDAF